MVYGQVDFNGTLRSLASNLDVVAHEMFHGVTVATCNLQYQDQSGALDESYADIFGTIISNFHIPNIDKWNWQCGDATSTSEKAFRDMSDPTLFKQPKHMQHYLQTSKDYGGVHTNSGIHNFAAYCIMTSKDDAGNFLFTPTELAALFYLSLTQHLNAQSQFNESRTGVIQWARSLFSNLPADALEARVKAIENGFSAAGIS
jgi:Zn-dependent metalloprotease